MKINKDNFVLSRYPIKLTVSEVESLLLRVEQNDEMAKKLIVCLIEHRLNHRYIRPLLHVPKEFKSGFLMMAVACLLIETLQSFYDGLEDTKDVSQKAFKDFFENETHKDLFPDLKKCFPGIAIGQDKGKDTFYKTIRCGILHQAETTGGYRILRGQSPLFDKNGNSINANKFMEATEQCLERYILALQKSKTDSKIWENAIKKVRHICAHCVSI